MKNLQIVFERDSGFVPGIIRTLTSFDSNHVGITYESDDFPGEVWVMEAVTKGTRVIPVKNRKWSRIYQVNCDLVPETRLAARYLGELYDFVGLAMFGVLIVVCRWLKVKFFRPHVTFKGQLCSELVARVLNVKFTEAFPSPQWTSPQEIDKFLKEHAEQFKLVE
jgi:hypothetical protein